MVAALKIGRVQALAAATHWGGRRWDADGERVRLDASIHAPGITDAKTLRAQLLGHVDNIDEEVVPVTWAADASIDGFYRVLGASVSMRGRALGHGLFDVSVELERTPHYAAPVFESVLVGATLTNSLGVVGAPWLGVPNEVDGHNITSVTANEGRAGADGTVRLFFYSTYSVVSRYLLAPVDYYKNAATFEVDDAASALQVVTGMQCENKPEDWRLSNGLVRVTPGTSGDLNVSHYDGTTWETAKQYFFDYTGQSLNNFDAVTILRNSPEEVTIRLTCSTTVPFSDGRVLVDLTLRRGDAFVRVYVTSEVARAWRLFRGTSEAATSITGGIRATSNDASGNRYVLTSATATSKDLIGGALFLPAAAKTVDFGIGNSIGGSGATGPNVITGTRGMVEQYFAAQAESMVVASR